MSGRETYRKLCTSPYRNNNNNIFKFNNTNDLLPGIRSCTRQVQFAKDGRGEKHEVLIHEMKKDQRSEKL
jgi:hypothetical protein